MHPSREFKVSVIMPVYNAQAYIEEAVLSAVNLKETGELILVDDGSTDHSLEVCQCLSKTYENVRLLRHVDQKNHGAAASRNLGIANAGCDYIAFLDADDYYLPNRFETEKEIFLNHRDVDGVYACNKALFQNESAKQKFLSRYDNELTTFSKSVNPEKLYRALLFGGFGRFHTSAITLHKRAFEKAGLFNSAIRYVEDTELWLKLSLKAKLLPGSIGEPVSIRRVHDSNSIHQTEDVYRWSRFMYQELFDWAVKQPFPFEVKNDFFVALHQFADNMQHSARILFFKQVRRIPSIIVSQFFIQKVHQLYFTK